MGMIKEILCGIGEKGICLETGHFLVFADRTQKGVAKHFSTLLERKYLKIHEDFRFPLEMENNAMQKETCMEEASIKEASIEETSIDKLRCYLCGNVPEYLKWTGKKMEDYEPWMVGYADSAQGKICLLLPEGSEGKEVEEKKDGDCTGDGQRIEELEKIAVHELVHIIFDRHCGVMDGEAWLVEGIAILYAKQTDLQYVNEEECPQIGILGGLCVDGETPDDFADNGGYDYAGIYVWYFIQKYGFEKFLAAYRKEICTCEILGEGFEKEAVRAYRRERAG